MKIDGLPVVDAKKKLFVKITDGDVKKGNSKEPDSCAAALACKREGHGTEARVYRSRTYVKVGKVWHRYVTPMSLQKEIVAFDRGGKFEVGDYYFMRPAKEQRLGSRTGERPYHKPKPSRPQHVTANIREHAPKGRTK